MQNVTARNVSTAISESILYLFRKTQWCSHWCFFLEWHRRYVSHKKSIDSSVPQVVVSHYSHCREIPRFVSQIKMAIHLRSMALTVRDKLYIRFHEEMQTYLQRCRCTVIKRCRHKFFTRDERKIKVYRHTQKRSRRRDTVSRRCVTRLTQQVLKVKISNEIDRLSFC